jgi:hypothetical protein
VLKYYHENSKIDILSKNIEGKNGQTLLHIGKLNFFFCFLLLIFCLYNIISIKWRTLSSGRIFIGEWC